MSRFIIHGRKSLHGTIRAVGNKNAALPMVAACLLTDEPVQLRNVPQIRDVDVMLQLVEQLGVSIERKKNSVTLTAASVGRREADPALCRQVRGSILLAGPMAARHGRAVLHPPGGDIIGRRRLDSHVLALEALGIKMTVSSGPLTFRRARLRGAQLLLDEASVTATENVMMAAVLAEGRTTLFNAACEPHVIDLGRLLNRMGARIRGLGTNRLVIDGVKALHGATHTLRSDHIEVGSYIAAAAVTGGELTITGVNDPDSLRVLERPFARLGVSWTTCGQTLSIKAPARLRVRKDLGSATPKIEDGAWPAFPSDLMSVAIVLATQARGSMLFFEKMFESRMYFIDHLLAMGAPIIQCDPHRVVVNGPARLHGTYLSSPDIRAGMALIIAALCAKGTSVIENAEIVDRGYERIDERLRDVGASIERESHGS